MMVFNLACDQGHRFEGWFRSTDAYLTQRAQSQVRCPVCESAEVEKLLTAPRLNLSGAKAPADSENHQTVEPVQGGAATDRRAEISNTTTVAKNTRTPTVVPDSVPENALNTGISNDIYGRLRKPSSVPGMPEQQALLERAIAALRTRILTETENVGRKFADVARAMNKGEEENRAIRGTVTPKEADALADEGIITMALPDGFLIEEKIH